MSATEQTRFYVTALNLGGESEPSNTVTNTPATGAPILVMTAPTLSTTNIAVGTSVQISGGIRNDGTGPMTLIAGSLTLLAPGATTADGPYVIVASLAPQTIPARGAVLITGTWTATTPTGAWTAYVVVQDDTGKWIPGPMTSFTVTAVPVPQPPAAPTNLRLQQLQGSRRDLGWDGDLTASAIVEKAIESDPFTQVAVLSPGILHWVDTRARQKTTRYRVKSCKALCSTWSEITWRP